MDPLFDVLRSVLTKFAEDKDISVPYFISALEPAQHIDFADVFFQASGKGKTRIKNVIQLAREEVAIKDLPEPERADYERLING